MQPLSQSMKYSGCNFHERASQTKSLNTYDKNSVYNYPDIFLKRKRELLKMLLW